MPRSESGLQSKDDFQRFCAELRRDGHELDDMVEGLRALATSSLGSRDKSRFARSIARVLSESVHPAQVEAVASVPWPPEIATALRPFITSRSADATELAPQGEAPATAPVFVDLREPASWPSPLDPGTAAVVLVGDETEHRASQQWLRSRGIHGLRIDSLAELPDAFGREPVIGLVVGASGWSTEPAPKPEPRPEPKTTPSARQRLHQILELSNLCWIKLVRSPAWTDVADQIFEICTSLYGAPPPGDRLTVEDRTALTRLDARCLEDAIVDITFAEHRVDYEFAPTIPQDRILRAVTSRVLRDKPTIHARAPRLHVRALTSEGPQRLVALVSVEGTDISYVVKVSPRADARQEARRFRMIAHGTSFELSFFCHGALGALVFAPVDTRLGHARSLDDLLSMHDPLAPIDGEPRVPHGPSIDSAIAALLRFSSQVRAEDATTFCTVESEDTRILVRRLGHLQVAGETIDLWWLYQEAAEIVIRSSRRAIVHGDAHPGNVLFSTTGAAILVDFECAGLGPPCLDLCTLWIFALGSRFVALGDEAQTVALFRALLSGTAFDQLVREHAPLLRLPVNVEVVYLASRALQASFEATRDRGGSTGDVHGIVAVLLCRELLNPELQQLVLRCALAAIQTLLRPA